jgi:predicted amidohydrolase
MTQPRTIRRHAAAAAVLLLLLSPPSLLAAEPIPPQPDPGQPTPARTVKVAAIQFESAFAQSDRNRQRLEPLVRQAARHGAKIIVLPETAIAGYMTTDLKTTWQLAGWDLSPGLRGRDPTAIAETVPGVSTERLGALARELDIYLTVPLLEKEQSTGKFFNTLVLVGPTGEILLHYRKLNPWPFAETGWASPGDRGHAVLDTPYGRLGLLICFDINFEPDRLRQQQVDTLLYSIAWVDRPKSSWFRVELPRIARDHNFNIIGANWTVPAEPDWHGYGQSLIIERTGRVLARVSRDIGEQIIYANLPVPARP